MAKKKKKSRASQKTEIVELPDLINRTDLFLVRLDACEMNRGESIADSQPGSQIQFQGMVEATSSGEPQSFLTFVFQFSISISAKKEPVQISATFRASYHLKEPTDVSDEEIHKFGSIVTMLNLWPYWREFVQSITTRMALPPLTLPLITPDALGEWQEEPPIDC